MDRDRRSFALNRGTGGAVMDKGISGLSHAGKRVPIGDRLGDQAGFAAVALLQAVIADQQDAIDANEPSEKVGVTAADDRQRLNLIAELAEKAQRPWIRACPGRVVDDRCQRPVEVQSQENGVSV
jgi:hypothetical protein